jgi:hypothetical protein
MEPTNMSETEHTPTIIIQPLGAMGYGNAESPISREKQLVSNELSQEVDVRSQEIIMSGEALVTVNDNDDGCIDGRETLELYGREGGEVVLKHVDDNSNHERAKVAGGGYITSQAVRLGVGMKGASIDEDLSLLGADLAERGIYCGAHTGAHKQGEGTDCGANDKLPLILHNALAYKEQIEGSTKALIETGGLSFNPEAFETVLRNWQAALDDTAYFEGSTGASRLQRIFATQAAATEAREGRKPVAVTKHLDGDHNEDYIIVNYVVGSTFSQGVLASKLRSEFPDKPEKQLAQAFVVDAWRVVELAENAAIDADFEISVYAGVMYQIATAATLTDGSLPIYAYMETK